MTSFLQETRASLSYQRQQFKKRQQCVLMRTCARSGMTSSKHILSNQVKI